MIQLKVLFTKKSADAHSDLTLTIYFWTSFLYSIKKNHHKLFDILPKSYIIQQNSHKNRCII